MKRRHFLTTTSAALAATALSGCESGQPVLRVYTWADYLAPELAKRFRKGQQLHASVIDTFDSNEAMFAKLTAGATGYDILMPSSYMVKSL